MPYEYISPLNGEPSTVQGHDPDGSPYFIIKPCVMTPLRVKALDGFRILLATAFMLLLFMVALGNFYEPHTEWIAVLWFAGGLYAIHRLLSGLVEKLLVKKSVIILSVKDVAVQGPLRWKYYDRNLEHRFAYIAHDKAQAEVVNNDLKLRKAAKDGKVIAPPVYYGNSAHVVMELAGHRVDLLEVFDQSVAGSIVARLQYCDRYLDASIKKSGGWGEMPEWDKHAPGGLQP